ncbi:hypothetical protein FBQ97_04995 [Acidobacteria bacterium ACD]|nr:MAG: hypothetical protein EDX89_13980 [Acidobacteriota bacterium]MCE7958897.1 hypothetical protein [Acidobacteria bacterium ACB2]MDL1949156.1 hypothetical protein [Acidobacteria bacterium ACD]
MNIRRAATLLALGLAASGIHAASVPQKTQWILASAKATGAGGEDFVTSLRITNPNTVTATVAITYLALSPLQDGRANGDNSSATTVTVTVDGGRTLPIEDVLGTKFGSAAPHGIVAGGLKIASDVPVSVLSRTYNAAARSSTGVPGTFGFSIPAQSADEAVSAGDTAYVSYVAGAPDRTKGYRSNFHMLNTVAEESVVHLKLVRQDGSVVGERDYTFAPLASAQENDIAKVYGNTALDENLTVFATVKSGGPVVVGASVIDNAIASINYAPPAKVFAPNNGKFGLILDDGGYGFSGRLDVYEGMPDFLSAGIVLEGCPAPTTVQLFFVQAFTLGGNKNTTFTKNADGSWAMSGSSSSATWTGTIFGDVDGSVFGTITYARSSGSAGGSCPGVGKTMSFRGARAEAIPVP